MRLTAEAKHHPEFVGAQWSGGAFNKSMMRINTAAANLALPGAFETTRQDVDRGCAEVARHKMLQRHPFDVFKSQSIPCRCGCVPSKGYRSLGREHWSMEASARTSMCVTKEEPSGAIASEPPNIALYAASYPPRALLSPPTLTRVCACDARRQRHVVGRTMCWAQQEGPV